MNRRGLLALILLASLLLSGCTSGRADKDRKPGDAAESTPFSGASVTTDALVTAYDGHSIPITIHRPIEATAKVPVPVILHSHGWAGSRATAPNAFRDYHAAGFAIISIDMRGHGQARTSSVAQVHHMEYEIKDVREVVTFAAGLDWVVQEEPGDPLVGAIGGSYGGGYQLLLAATDPRLDAMAPEITWHSLLDSLAPNGAVKSAWVDVLYGAGNANARLHTNIHQGFATANSQNRIPDGSGPSEYDLASQFRRSSPQTYPGLIQVPTLLIQGVNDTLFNFNEAEHNYEMIQQTKTEVRLVTHLGGHVLNTRGTIPVPAPQPVGLQPPSGGSPCGSLREITIAFHQVHLLKRRNDLGPQVCLALEDGSFVTPKKFPVPASSHYEATRRVEVIQPSSSRSVHPLLQAPTDGLILAGVPKLSANVTTSGDAILYYSLEATRNGVSRTLNAQVMPYRHLRTESVEFELGGVGARLAPGESLALVIETQDEQFSHNAGRNPATTILQDVRVALPVHAPR